MRTETSEALLYAATFLTFFSFQDKKKSHAKKEKQKKILRSLMRVSR